MSRAPAGDVPRRRCRASLLAAAGRGGATAARRETLDLYEKWLDSLLRAAHGRRVLRRATGTVPQSGGRRSHRGGSGARDDGGRRGPEGVPRRRVLQDRGRRRHGDRLRPRRRVALQRRLILAPSPYHRGMANISHRAEQPGTAGPLVSSDGRRIPATFAAVGAAQHSTLIPQTDRWPLPGRRAPPLDYITIMESSFPSPACRRRARARHQRAQRAGLRLV